MVCGSVNRTGKMKTLSDETQRLRCRVSVTVLQQSSKSNRLKQVKHKSKKLQGDPFTVQGFSSNISFFAEKCRIIGLF